jgi:hypothetical protein
LILGFKQSTILDALAAKGFSGALDRAKWPPIFFSRGSLGESRIVMESAVVAAQQRADVTLSAASTITTGISRTFPSSLMAMTSL